MNTQIKEVTETFRTKYKQDDAILCFLICGKYHFFGNDLLAANEILGKDCGGVLVCNEFEHFVRVACCINFLVAVHSSLSLTLNEII